MDRNSSVLLVTEGGEAWRASADTLADTPLDASDLRAKLRTSHPDIARVVVLGEGSRREHDDVSASV